MRRPMAVELATRFHDGPEGDMANLCRSALFWSALVGVQRQYMGCAGPDRQRRQHRLLLLRHPRRACPGRRPRLCARPISWPMPAAPRRAAGSRPRRSPSSTKPQLALDICSPT